MYKRQDAGDIDALMNEAQSYQKALVYQTVGKLEDSYDFEGMMEAARLHNELCLLYTSHGLDGYHLADAAVLDDPLDGIVKRRIAQHMAHHLSLIHI